MTDMATTPTATGVTGERLRDLRRWNTGLTVLHLAQAVALLLLTSDFAIGVISSFPDGPPGTEGLSTSTIVEVRIGWAVALFLGLAGLDHLLTATAARRVYERDLGRGINRFRWAGYSVSATVMVILISLYWGIVTINALILVAGANVAMILSGWLLERMNPPGRTSTTMLPFWFGSLVGITPWLAMGVNLFYDSDDAPGALFAILIIQGLFFFCLGLNQWLQYREIGRWTDYGCGEKTYLVLSLAAKSLLARQIVAVSLAT